MNVHAGFCHVTQLVSHHRLVGRMRRLDSRKTSDKMH